MNAQESIKKFIKKTLAQREFWHYCNVISPDFYQEHREHLKLLCNTLDNFYKGKLLKNDGKPYKKLIINMPPQHGKTRTLINFCQWILGNNNQERIIACSYNDDTASDFSRYTRDGIQVETIDDKTIVFSDIFPKTKIKRGYASFQKWALEGQHFNYLGAGIGGSITSKGATVLIVDDPIKGAEEALNETHLDKIWLWYTSTFLSRVSAESGEPLEIIVMTRWSKKDVCGRLLASEMGKDWYELSFKAYDNIKDKMLCPDFLSQNRYRELKSIMVDEIFLANYDQDPIDIKGRLYKELKIYEEPPKDKNGNILFQSIENYTDTADQGKDYLCSICFGVYRGEAYVIDVLYTKEGMEITEEQTAKMLYVNKVNIGKVESNNGGRGFARNVERILKDDFKSNKTIIKWFHQTENKIARIISNSAWIQEHVYFPVNWKDKWPKFYTAITTYQKEAKNKHDDAPDALTGVAERFNVAAAACSGVDPDEQTQRHGIFR